MLVISVYTIARTSAQKVLRMTAECMDGSASRAMYTMCFKASRRQHAEETCVAFRGSEDLGFI